MFQPMTCGLTPAGAGVERKCWTILGQTYWPLAITEACFAFEALLPPGTFVPPHVQEGQDEFIRVLEGSLDLMLDGVAARAGPGDFVRIPRGTVHGVFNNGAVPARALGWATPALNLAELFERADGVADPEEVLRMATANGVRFLPPD
ncbi:MAG: cupin domain-containing protein [Pseudomonadota bacterium]